MLCSARMWATWHCITRFVHSFGRDLMFVKLSVDVGIFFFLGDSCIFSYYVFFLFFGCLKLSKLIIENLCVV